MPARFSNSSSPVTIWIHSMELKDIPLDTVERLHGQGLGIHSMELKVVMVILWAINPSLARIHSMELKDEHSRGLLWSSRRGIHSMELKAPNALLWSYPGRIYWNPFNGIESYGAWDSSSTSSTGWESIQWNWKEQGLVRPERFKLQFQGIHSMELKERKVRLGSRGRGEGESIQWNWKLS